VIALVVVIGFVLAMSVVGLVFVTWGPWQAIGMLALVCALGALWLREWSSANPWQESDQ
jgi:hypothetical protein